MSHPPAEQPGPDMSLALPGRLQEAQQQAQRHRRFAPLLLPGQHHLHRHQRRGDPGLQAHRVRGGPGVLPAVQRLLLGARDPLHQQQPYRWHPVCRGEPKAGQSVAADVSFFTKPELDLGDKEGTFSFGMNISNIGAKMSYTETARQDFIPMNMRLGPAFTLDLDQYNSITFNLTSTSLLVPTPPIYKLDSAGAVEIYPTTGEFVIASGKDLNGVAQGIIQSFSDAPGNVRYDDNGNAIVEGRSASARRCGSSIWREASEYWYDQRFAFRAGYREHYTKGNRKYFTLVPVSATASSPWTQLPDRQHAAEPAGQYAALHAGLPLRRQAEEGGRTRARMTPFRIGYGYDVHRLVEGDLWLGGEGPRREGRPGPFDADVLLHAILRPRALPAGRYRHPLPRHGCRLEGRRQPRPAAPPREGDHLRRRLDRGQRGRHAGAGEAQDQAPRVRHARDHRRHPGHRPFRRGHQRPPPTKAWVCRPRGACAPMRVALLVRA